MHDRYLHEVVEALNLCPFSRKSREAGRVERPIFRPASPDGPASAACDLLEATIDTNPEVEIILLTAPVRLGHPWRTPATFDGFLTELRAAFDARPNLPAFYMVTFHPMLKDPSSTPARPHQLVSWIRRTPDPVIQCVRAETLDAVRRQAQAVHDARIRAQALAHSPEMAALLDRCVTTDPEISSDIAEANFDAVGRGDGLARLDALIAEIHRERDERYADPPA